MKCKAYAFIAMAVFWAAHAHADASHSIQTYELSDTGQRYVECLGQVVTFNTFIEGRFHEFETKGGTWHLLDNWFFVQYASDPLGRQWVGKGKGPYQENAKLTKGDVWQFTARTVLKPLTEDTPTFLFENHMKMTIDANGELRVFHDESPTIYRCLPK